MQRVREDPWCAAFKRPQAQGTLDTTGPRLPPAQEQSLAAARGGRMGASTGVIHMAGALT